MILQGCQRAALLMHGAEYSEFAKTGFGYLRYGTIPVVVIVDGLRASEKKANEFVYPPQIPVVPSMKQAMSFEPDVLFVGSCRLGGAMPDEMWEDINEALRQHVKVVSGLHTFVKGHEKIAGAPVDEDLIWDVRSTKLKRSSGTAKAKSLDNRRFLFVGSDMSVGKMSAGIELYKIARKQGMKAVFLSTGQTGMMLFGFGIPLDAVPVDFASGAVEDLVLQYGQGQEVVFIEGQGSLFHPSSTATLPLLRGSQPTDLIYVHRAGQKSIRDLPHVLIPPLPEAISMYETLACASASFTKPKVRGICLNTARLSETEALKATAETAALTGLPCIDAVRFDATSFWFQVMGP